MDGSADGIFHGSSYSLRKQWKDSKIGSSTRCLPAGIYYLSQKENSLGQLQTDGELKLTGGTDRLAYYMDKDGRAYTNTLVDGKVYGPDGTRIQ